MSETIGNSIRFESVYLAVGEDALKRQAVHKRLCSRLSGLSDATFDYDEFKGETARGKDIVNACDTLPLMGEYRHIFVNNAEKLGARDVEVLIDYLSNPSPSSILELSCEKLPKNSRLYKTLNSANGACIIDCSLPNKKKLPDMVQALANNYGIKLSSSAVLKLIDLVGEDTLALDSEIKKLALSYQGKHQLGVNEIQEFVRQSSAAKPYEILDAMSSRNLALLCKLLHKAHDSQPLYLISIGEWRIRDLICARSLIDRGCSHELANQLKIQDWRAKNLLRWAALFSKEELRQALINARETEKKMKSGADAALCFNDWIISVAKKSTR